MNGMLSKIKVFWSEYEPKIVLLVGFLLVSSLSFEAGVIWGQKWQQKPLIIEKQVDISQEGEMVKSGLSEASGAVSEVKPNTQNPIPKTSSSCNYVGSKNSKKFYLSTCSWAKRIKPENIVCFATPAEAVAQGRTESKCN